MVHQVLERYHSEGGTTLERMLDLLEAGWRRAGFGESERERMLRAQARNSFTLQATEMLSLSDQPMLRKRHPPLRVRYGISNPAGMLALAAGLREVGASAARAANNRCDHLDDVARLDLRREVRRHGHHQCNLVSEVGADYRDA